MEVVFRTKRLQRNFQKSVGAVRQWGPEVGRKYITRIEQLYAAKDFGAVYNIRSLSLHPLKGPMQGYFSIYLTGKWRLLITKGDTEAIVFIEEVSNHYDD